MKKTYDEKSPITGNMSVLVDRDESTGMISKMCIESGFNTNSFLVEGSKTMDQLKTTIPKIAYNLRVVDSNNNVWIPTMQSTEFSSIYPFQDPSDSESFLWRVTPIKKLTEEESKRYPNPDKPGEFMDSFIDFENSQEFPREDFAKAFECFINMNGND
jgi:hypothetical protein